MDNTFDSQQWQVALDEKRGEIKAAVSNRIKELVDLYIAMSRVGLRSSAELIKLIDKEHYKGPLPTTDFDDHGTFCITAPQRWTSYYEANQWAAPILSQANLYAIAGSHRRIETKRLVPLGLMKFASMVYQGDGKDRYTTKEIVGEVVSFDESITRKLSSNNLLEQHLKLRQFERTMTKLVEYIHSISDTDSKPICLFEFPSFNQFPDDDQQVLAHAIRGVFDASCECSVPVVGCQQSPSENDLVQFIAHLAKLKVVYPIYDVLILEADDMRWGERTPIFVKDWHSLASGFVYLRTAMNIFPIRLNFPLWMIEQELVEQVVNVVLADCIMASGHFRLLNTAQIASQFRSTNLRKIRTMLEDFVNNKLDDGQEK